MFSDSEAADEQGVGGRAGWRALVASATAVTLMVMTVFVAWQNHGYFDTITPGYHIEQQRLDQLHDAVHRYRNEHGEWPPMLDAAVPPRPDTTPEAPRLELIDLWQTPYHYEIVGVGFDLRSYGPDRQHDGAGLGDDITPSATGTARQRVPLGDFLANVFNPFGFWLLVGMVGAIGFVAVWSASAPGSRDQRTKRLAANIVVVAMASGVAIVLVALHVIPSGH